MSVHTQMQVVSFSKYLPSKIPFILFGSHEGKKGLFCILQLESQDTFQNCTPCGIEKYVPTLVTEYFQKRTGGGAGISTIVLSQRDAFPSFFDQKRKVFFSSPRFPHHDHYCFPNGAGLREEAREKKETGQTKKSQEPPPCNCQLMEVSSSQSSG